MKKHRYTGTYKIWMDIPHYKNDLLIPYIAHNIDIDHPLNGFLCLFEAGKGVRFLASMQV